jgi:xanthine dehydrogenase accessory factor
MVCGGMVEVLFEVLTAKPLLVACGGGPVGQALARNALLCGFDVLVAEDREAYRAAELFPAGTRFAAVERSDWGALFAAPRADSRDATCAEPGGVAGGRDLYVAVVSRCWETDLAAMQAVIRAAPCGLRYLGLMGSRRKVDRILGELAALDLEPPADLRAPIGLPIGGETPGELAVSILAEMIECRRAAAQRDRPLAADDRSEASAISEASPFDRPSFLA